LLGIIIINGRQPEEETIEKAEEEDIPIMVSKLPAFQLVGELYHLGISGQR
jgi:predicted transcriptional regulator